MSTVVCPHCHIHLDPLELEEAASGAGRYLICPECDTPVPLSAEAAPRPGAAGAAGDARASPAGCGDREAPLPYDPAAARARHAS